MSTPLPRSWPSPTAVDVSTSLLLATTTLASPCSSESSVAKSPSWSAILREHMAMVVAAASGLVVVVVLLLVLIYCLYWNKSGMQLRTAFPSFPLIFYSVRSFTLDELKQSTGDFSQDNVLGEGGFGPVYHGVLPDQEEIAVKRQKVGSRQGEREFRTELKIMSRLHHKNVVSLVGYCTEGSERILVYKLVPNRSLEFHLHGEGRPTLAWEDRMKVAVGSAKGLAYLHEDCILAIIHRDIKAANILVDSDFEAKIADFGFAKFKSESNRCVSMLVGTFGYIALECARGEEQTEKSDTYSLGVVLLELITGRRPVSSTDDSVKHDLVSLVSPLLEQALRDRNFDSLVDPRLLNNYNHSEMARMVACAAACLRESAQCRPKMSLIALVLEGHQSAADLDDGIGAGSSNLDLKCGSSQYREPTGECGFYPSDSSRAGPSRQTVGDLEMEGWWP